MNEINIKMLTEDALLYIKNNTELIFENIMKHDDNKWIKDVFPFEKVFETKNIRIRDFEIKLSDDDDKRISFENCVALYENLKHIPRYILLNERFWLWLYLDKFYKETKRISKLRKITSFRNGYLFTLGVRRGLFFGILSRCYLCAELTFDETNTEDKYHLTKFATEYYYRYREIGWRSFSSQRHLVRGILKGEKRAIEEFKPLENLDLYTKLAKYIKSLGSVMLLDSISEEDISEMTYEKVVELISR